MSGLTYLLLRNPEKMKELTSEIRSSFTSSDDITMESTANLKYLNACAFDSILSSGRIPYTLY